MEKKNKISSWSLSRFGFSKMFHFGFPPYEDELQGQNLLPCQYFNGVAYIEAPDYKIRRIDTPNHKI